MSHRIPIACVARLGEGDLAVLAVHIGDTCQALNAEAALTELIAAALEALLNGDADAGNFGARSLADLNKALKRAAVGQEVVDNRTLSPSDRKRLPTMTGYSFCLVEMVVAYCSPSRLMDCAFLAKTTGTPPKC